MLGKLLEAEAASQGVSMATIDLGGNQNAPDGGIDAAIVWQDGPESGGWLPRRMTYYKCKAQALPPAVVEAEMRPGWSPLGRMLITMAPEPVSVLQAFEERFFSGVSSGPFSLRFVRRRPLVEAMLTHDDPSIRNWAREAAERLERQILYWDERDREQDSLFE